MFLQDWLTLKIVKIENKWINIELKNWDKIAYKKEWKKYIWTYIWYECNADYKADFLYKLNYKQVERFYQLNKKAENIFNNIKDELKIVFPKLKFITAKMNYSGDIIYLYFFYEDRIDFRPYLKELKQLIWMNFFLYQVWARDRIRLHPKSKYIYGDCWHQLCCTKHMCKIDTIPTSTIHLQNLQSQNIDHQKGVCGKLKCCLKYEEEHYKKEIEKYPKIWTSLEIEWKKYIVAGINVLSKYIFLKDDKWFISKFNLDNYK